MKRKKEPVSLVRRTISVVVRVALTLALGAIGTGLCYAALVTGSVSRRFDGRKWSVPSRVYSDILLMYPGQRLSSKQFIARIDRLGYQRTKGKVAEGQYRVSRRTVTVGLRPIEVPVLSREAMTVQVDFGKSGAVATMKNVVTGETLPILELEPEELMQVFGEQHESRLLVSVEQVPKDLIRAVLAAEDADFFSHWGVDVTAIMRALYVNVKAGGVQQGGSTLTQQLAKTFFLSPKRTVTRKLKEIVIALIIEQKYSKNEILEIYLNEVYLGQRGTVAVHGFGEAARFYFGKPLERLNAAQCATLAGIIRGPNRYAPFAHPEATTKRRNQVLQAMHQRRDLDDEALAAAVSSPLGLVEFAPYTRTAPYFFDYLASQLSTMYPQTDLSRIGLKMYTTLDVGVQEQAERALAEGLARLEKKHERLKRNEPDKQLQGAIVVLQPSSGHVIAMVGGRDYGRSQFNRITQAKRQPGSAFKPFVLLSALDTFPLTAKFNNEPKTYRDATGKRWRPKNYGGEYGGTVSIRKAITSSLNLPTIDLAEQVGLPKVIETARTFGLTTNLEPRLSLALGAFEVVPLELATAYAAFAHDGVLPVPLSLQSVVDEDDQEVRRQHFKLKSVTTPARAFMVGSVLRDVVEHGTARGLKGRGIKYPVAGKTGTTNAYRDAWFVGYTPDLVALVWVGFDDGTSLKLAASRVAVPIWADLMNTIGWRTSKRWFAAPEGVVEAKVCADTGHLAHGSCPHPINELYEPHAVPTETCEEHRSSFRRFLDSLGF